MNPKPGNRNSIRIGGDASAPVVAGNGNIVEVSDGQGTSEAAGQLPLHGQRNKAEDRGSVFAVTHGDMHIQQAGEPRNPEE
ncbi:hypothetical protein GCM10027570_13380 [Streptomonospora sediminis]